jgi:asparagine synthase (glutamine-hydrolysing)
MDFVRLSINDTSDDGMQPFVRNTEMLVCNGEIYNHRDFETGKELSGSDCECLLGMLKQHGIRETCNLIRGVFAFAWSDGDRLLVARDPVGVRPLFYTRTPEGSIVFASEMKVLPGRVDIFPPGHFYDSYLDDFVCYHNLYWTTTPVEKESAEWEIQKRFEESVARRITNADCEIGFLLSGGLDSSLVAVVAKKLGVTNMKTFSIGQTDSPDILAARKVAEFLGSNHHEVLFDFDEGVQVIPEVIKSLESYDTTTIRASTPMWLLCKWISKNTNCKVILSGEGSDELFGGYLYFKGAPSEEAFQAETIRRVRLLHQFDVLRADRCAAAHGLELRVPFLDRDFVDTAIQIPPGLKMTTEEKKILRDAFDGYLPEEILRRKKDAFSDAVGYGWVDHVKTHASKLFSDSLLKVISVQTNNHNTPITMEEAMYRHIFYNLYGQTNDHLISEIWRPKWTDVVDPSARQLKFSSDS